MHAARKDQPTRISALSGTSGEFATIPAFEPVPLSRQHRPSQCGFRSNFAISSRKSARSRTESNSLPLANRS
jgi:hypothetical protein